MADSGLSVAEALEIRMNGNSDDSGPFPRAMGFFDPNARPVHIEYNSEKTAAALDRILILLPKESIIVTDNLFDLQKYGYDFYRSVSDYLKLAPTRNMRKGEFFAKSAKLIVDYHDLTPVVDIPELESLEELLNFLCAFKNEFEDYLVVGAENFLGQAFSYAFKTDREREAYLVELLKKIGYPNAVVNLKPEPDISLGPSLSYEEVKPERLWKESKSDFNNDPIDFVKKIYGKWLNKGLTRTHILKVDKPLYFRLANYIRDHDGKLPDGLDLPTRSEVVDRKLAKIDPTQMREVSNLDAAQKMRRRAGTK